MLYKYRSLSNIQRTLDILINKRMYAAKFQSLNDPMEGVYRYEPTSLSEEDIRRIFDQKNAYRLLSLSDTYNNMLMWSYYTESHKGLVIGVSISDTRSEIIPVEYVDDLTIDTTDGDTAKIILTKKLKFWSHEKEHRAFIQNKKFIKIKVHKIIFGVNTSKETKELVRKIAQKFCPDVEISDMTHANLDKGVGEYSDL